MIRKPERKSEEREEVSKKEKDANGPEERDG